MPEMLQLGTTFLGASVVAFIVFAGFGVLIYVVAPSIWREKTAYWADVAGIFFLIAGTSLVSFVVFAIYWLGGVLVEVPKNKPAVAVAILLFSFGLVAIGPYLKMGGYLKETTKWKLLVVAALLFASAAILTIGTFCAFLAKHV